MTNPEFFINLLGIDNIEIINIEQIDDEIFIYVSSTEEHTNCHQCGKITNCSHGSAPEIKLRHLPIFKLKTYIIIKPKRYLCDDHSNKTTTTQKLSWYRERSTATYDYENHILLSMINSTIQDVSCKEEIGYAVIENIIDKNISSKMNWNEIKTVEVRKSKSIREFGGWGYRIGKRKRAYTLYGHWGLDLTLNNDKHLFIGTQKHCELEAFLKDFIYPKYSGLKPENDSPTECN